MHAEWWLKCMRSAITTDAELERAFTLIELMVVIATIAIMAAMKFSRCEGRIEQRVAVISLPGW